MNRVIQNFRYPRRHILLDVTFALLAGSAILYETYMMTPSEKTYSMGILYGIVLGLVIIYIPMAMVVLYKTNANDQN